MSIENLFFNALNDYRQEHEERLLEIKELLKFQQISSELAQVRSELLKIQQEIKKLMATLEETLADVQSEKTQIDSLSTLTAGIKKQLDDVLAGALTPAQQAKVDAIFAGVEANKQAVVDAINANTPQAPPPTV